VFPVVNTHGAVDDPKGSTAKKKCLPSHSNPRKLVESSCMGIWWYADEMSAVPPHPASLKKAGPSRWRVSMRKRLRGKCAFTWRPSLIRRRLPTLLNATLRGRMHSSALALHGTMVPSATP
jgi:hypothetical protein